MKNKNLSFLLLILLTCLFLSNKISSKNSSFVIHNDCDTINLKDKYGKKQGLWIENIVIKTMTYYKDDFKNGVFRSFHRNGSIYGIGEYKKNRFVGTWYSFYNNGSIEYKQIFLDNKDSRFNYYSYLIYYYCDGGVELEGHILHDEDFEIGYTEDGIWKYYDKNSTKIKEELYENGELVKTIICN